MEDDGDLSREGQHQQTQVCFKRFYHGLPKFAEYILETFSGISEEFNIFNLAPYPLVGPIGSPRSEVIFAIRWPLTFRVGINEAVKKEKEAERK